MHLLTQLINPTTAGCEHLCCIVCAVRCTQEQGCCPICRRSADASRTDDTSDLQSNFIDFDTDVSSIDSIDGEVQILQLRLRDALSTDWDDYVDPTGTYRDPDARLPRRRFQHSRAAASSTALVPGMLEADTKRLRKAVSLVFSGLVPSLTTWSPIGTRSDLALLSRRASEPAVEVISIHESHAQSRLRSQSV